VLAVRPESIVPISDGPPINTIRATLEGRTYLGAISTLSLRVGDAGLRVTRPESAVPLTDAEVNATTWTVDPQDLILLPPS
jgi:hypothetical protein